MGVQMIVRSMARVGEHDEKVKDLAGEILAPRSTKKVRVCWKPSIKRVR